MCVDVLVEHFQNMFPCFLFLVRNFQADYDTQKTWHGQGLFSDKSYSISVSFSSGTRSQSFTGKTNIRFVFSVPSMKALIDHDISSPQFGQYMKLISEMVRRVETEHRTKLEQLNKMQEQTKYGYS